MIKNIQLIKPVEVSIPDTKPVIKNLRCSKGHLVTEELDKTALDNPYVPSLQEVPHPGQELSV